MSGILYYSNFCEHSKKLLQTLSKSQVRDDVHFICIDKRVKGQDGKTYIVLENGQKIVMANTVERVPALLQLTNNFQVLYGDNIYTYFKPKQETITRQVTQNNMEPMAFSLGGGCVVSDQYSFLDMEADELNTKGNGGLRQMHNYVTLNHADVISTPSDDKKNNQPRMQEEVTIEKLQKMREQEISNYSSK
jgi:hypothetical protein